MTELLKLSPLRNIDYTALDYETLQTELIDYIRANYATNGINDDFLDSSAGRLFIDLLSYFGNILSFREDTLANEAYLPTAVRRQSIINILANMGEAIETAKPAFLNVTALMDTIPLADVIIPAKHQIPAYGTDGQNIIFEIMKAKDDYWSTVVIPAGVSTYNVNAYEGQFKFEYFQSTGQPNQIVKLIFSPIIFESIQVSVSPVPPSQITASELINNRGLKVYSLIDPNVNSYIYKEEFDNNGAGTLYFATESYGKIPPAGYYVYIAYRIGGGARGNIAEGSITGNASFYDASGSNIPIKVYFSNPGSRGVNGEDAQSLDNAKEEIPLKLRTAYKLVTLEDYTTLLRQIDGIRDVDLLDYQTYRMDTNVTPNPVPHNTVNIWVYPKDSDILTDDLRQEIVSFLDERKMIAVDHQIFPANFINWGLMSSSNASQTYSPLPAVIYHDQFTSPTALDTLIRNALIAEFSGDNIQFGKNVYLTKVTSVIQSIDGVNHVDIKIAEVLPDNTGRLQYSGTTNIEILQKGEIARLVNDFVRLTYVKEEI